MRREFVEAKGVVSAQLACPWAEVVVKVDGGYLCFGSEGDYETWNNQK